MASIDVKLGFQIWQILLQLGIQFESEAEISPWTDLIKKKIQIHPDKDSDS
jgi:hypothetical protein